MKIRRKLIKIGNSVGLTIPQVWADTRPEYRVDNGDEKFVIVDLRDDGTFTVCPDKSGPQPARRIRTKEGVPGSSP